MFQPLAIFRSYSDASLHGLPIHVQRGLFSPALVELHVDHGPFVIILENYVYIDRRGEEI